MLLHQELLLLNPPLVLLPCHPFPVWVILIHTFANSFVDHPYLVGSDLTDLILVTVLLPHLLELCLPSWVPTPNVMETLQR